MHLSFIGMSGVGKSYWAKQLAQAGWLHLDCDARIAARLGEIIEVHPLEQPVHAIGRWMGMPWSDGFGDREQRYLDLEREVTRQALEEIQNSDGSQPSVLDTTGSVIYTGDEMLGRLKQSPRLVYIQVTGPMRQQMVDIYLREPKPVLWNSMYSPQGDESRYEALERCYRVLLDDRAERYKALADVTIDYYDLQHSVENIDQLLAMIDG